MVVVEHVDDWDSRLSLGQFDIITCALANGIVIEVLPMVDIGAKCPRCDYSL